MYGPDLGKLSKPFTSNLINNPTSNLANPFNIRLMNILRGYLIWIAWSMIYSITDNFTF
jgi:hypothetical protein